MKRLDDEAIYMVLAQQRSSWLAGWYRQMLTLSLVGAVIAALLSILTWSSIRQAFKQQRVQRELSKARERYDLAVSGVEDGIWDWDLESNEIYFSPVWFRILGYAADELPSETATWSSSVHAEDLDMAHGKIAGAPGWTIAFVPRSPPHALQGWQLYLDRSACARRAQFRRASGAHGRHHYQCRA